ncbi:MAG: glycosyl hydrolase [Planctomycetota bacterium]
MNKREFKNPGKEYRPSPFWSWNDTLDPEELKWQVREFADKGFGGYFMHSRVGLGTKYLSDDWMKCIAACLEQGKESGAESWLYDEDKWPSGFAGGLLTARGDEYRARTVKLSEIQRDQIAAAVADPSALGVFAVAFSSPGAMSKFRKIGSSADAKDGERIFAFRVCIQQKSNWYNGETYADLLNPAVTEEFLKITLDPYAARFRGDFGEFMPGVFTDEPNYPAQARDLPWTGAMADYFQSLHGYDIREKLPLLYFDGDGDRKARHDFWRAATLRFAEAFSVPFGKRCEELGLMLTGHYLAEDNLLSQIRVIGAAMPHYEFMQCPGIDHLGRNILNPLTLKQCSSASHQFGRNRILCEIFGVSGHSMSFEDQKWIADFHFALGITFLCQHLTLYTMKGDAKRDYPPTISYQQTYWPQYKMINDYFARAGYICSQGDFHADILLLHPIASAWATYAAAFDQERNDAARKYDQALARMIDDLLAIHRDYDLGDEILLERHARVRGGMVRVAKKGAYKIIVVPPSLTWSKATFNLLRSFLKSGGKVLFVGERPTCIDAKPAEKRWETIFTNANVRSVAHDRKAVEQALDEMLPRDISVEDASGAQIEDIYVHHRIHGRQHIYFLSSKSRDKTYAARVVLPIQGEVTEWNMITGAANALPARAHGGGMALDLCFAPVGSYAFTVDTAKPIIPVSSAAYSEVGAARIGGDWAFERLHPNSFTLDTCRFRVDGGEWSAVLPIWKARRHVWNESGLKEHAGVQPWAIFAKGIRPKPMAVEIETAFESEVEGKKVGLVMELPDRWRLTVNDVPVPTATSERHWDKQFGRIDISANVKKGRNTIRIACTYGFDTHIEDLYLVGDFGVKKISGTQYVLTDEPAKLTDGDWGAQGYPFYAGSMRYKTTAQVSKSSGDKFTLRLKDPKGSLFVVHVNGKARPVYCQPWEVDVTDLLKDGANAIAIDVIGTLRNTFGPLHHKLGDDLGWVGPAQFVDEKNWVDDYQLVPYGLLGGAGLVAHKRGR